MNLSTISFAFCIGIILSPNFLCSQSARKKFGSVPNSKKLINEDSLVDVVPFKKYSLIWPSDELIKLKRIPNERKEVQEAITDTMFWLKTVMRSELVPNETEIDILPLESGLNNLDVIRFRYSIGEYIIQVSSTAATIAIVIGFIDKIEKKDYNTTTIKPFINKYINIFFNSSEKIFEKSSWKVNKNLAGFEGRALSFPLDWWQTVSWWTNGEIVLFSVRKASSSNPRLKVTDAQWFSSLRKNSNKEENQFY